MVSLAEVSKAIHRILVCVEGTLRLGLLVFVLPGILFFAMSQLRLVDGDEGFYLLASRLVAEGQAPYHDFFYPQTPLLPYAYSGWAEVFGLSWRSARCLSALFAGATSVIVYALTRCCGASPRRALLAVVVFALSGPTLAWLVVVKTYPLALFLLVAAALLIVAPSTRFSLLRLFLAGVLVGCAIGTRLTMTVALPAFAYSLFTLEAYRRHKLAAFAAAGFGLACGILPIIWTMAGGPERFWFDNVGYHLEGGPPNLFANLAHKFKILTRLAGARLMNGDAGSYHYLIHFLLFGCAWRRGLFDDPRRRFLAVLVGCLVLGHLLPKQVHLQYFVAVIPFTSCVAALVPGSGGSTRSNRVLLTLALIGVFLAPLEWVRLTAWGHKVPGVRGHADAINWRIGTILRVSTELDDLLEPDSLVFASWPGYLVETRLQPLPGTENHFARSGAIAIDLERSQRYRVAGVNQIETAIRERRPSAVVLGNWSGDMRMEEPLDAAGYRPARSIEGARVYTRPGRAASRVEQ